MTVLGCFRSWPWICYRSGWNRWASWPWTSWPWCSGTWTRQNTWQWTSQLLSSFCICCRMPFSFFFIFSISRGFRAATLLGILRCFYSACWIVWSARWASSGSDSLSWPAVMAGYFFICLFSITRRSSVSFFFLPEAFFLGGTPGGQSSLDCRPIMVHPWSDFLCRHSRIPVVYNGSLVFRWKGFNPFSLWVRRHLVKLSQFRFLTEVQGSSDCSSG